MVGFFKQKLSVPRVALPIDSNSKVEAFDSGNEKHQGIINARVARFKEALEAISTVDKGIALGFTMSSVVYGVNSIPYLPYIPLSLTIGMAGTFILAYSLGCRSKAYEKYQKAFIDLKEVYEWSMGTRRSDNEYWYAIREKAVQEMILTLGPWVPKEVICTWKEKDLKSGLIPEYVKERLPLRQAKELSEDFKGKLSALASGSIQAANWQYRYYGENNMGDFSVIAEGHWEQAKSLGLSLKAMATKLVGTFMAAPSPKPHSG